MDGAVLRVVEIGKSDGIEIPDSIVCQGLQFPEPLKPSAENVVIQMQAVYTEFMQPLPDSITQDEWQKMSFKDNLYAIVPYTVQKQQTNVM